MKTVLIVLATLVSIAAVGYLVVWLLSKIAGKMFSNDDPVEKQ